MKKRTTVKKPEPAQMVSGSTTYLLEVAQAVALMAWASERAGHAVELPDAACHAILYLAQQERRRRAGEHEAPASPAPGPSTVMRWVAEHPHG